LRTHLPGIRQLIVSREGGFLEVYDRESGAFGKDSMSSEISLPSQGIGGGQMVDSN